MIDMARKRVEGAALQNYQDADQVLRKIGELDRKIGAIEASTNEAIDHAKYIVKQAGEPLQAIKTKLERQLKELCETNRADFAQVRTRELTFGSIGLRKSWKVMIK